MRQPTILTSAVLLAAAAVSVSAASSGSGSNSNSNSNSFSLSQCLENRGAELAGLASCGDAGLLAYCMSLIPGSSDGSSYAAALLEQCYTTAGCTAAEAEIEAFWAQRQCEKDDGSHSQNENNNNNENIDDEEEEENADLRRRREEGGSEALGAMPLARDGGVAAAAVMVTVMAGAPVTVTRVLGGRDATFSSSSTSSPSPCFTTSLVTTSVCPTQSTGTDSGSTLPCYPTSSPTSVCAKGLVCASAEVCMYEQGFGTTGAIVMLFFAGAVVISVASMCFFCCRERREQKRLEAAAEAAAIARESKSAAAAASARADRQPLMASSAAASPKLGAVRPVSPLQHPQTQAQPQRAELGEADVTSGQNPFADSQHPALR